MEIILIISLLIMLGGLSGIVIPIVPSTPLILMGIVIYAACDGFESISRLLLLLLGVLTIVSVVLDYFGGIIGAKKFGATKWGIIGSIFGCIGGFITGGIVGIIIGPFLGAVLLELVFGKDLRGAFKSGVGTLVGFIGGAVVKLAIGVIMIGIFIWKVF
jgi:hypothetical protein